MSSAEYCNAPAICLRRWPLKRLELYSPSFQIRCHKTQPFASPFWTSTYALHRSTEVEWSNTALYYRLKVTHLDKNHLAFKDVHWSILYSSTTLEKTIIFGRVIWVDSCTISCGKQQRRRYAEQKNCIIFLVTHVRMTVDHKFPNGDNADSDPGWREVTKRQVMNTGTQYKVLTSR